MNLPEFALEYWDHVEDAIFDENGDYNYSDDTTYARYMRKFGPKFSPLRRKYRKRKILDRLIEDLDYRLSKPFFSKVMSISE